MHLSKRLLLVAVEVVAVPDLQQVAVPLVKPDPVLDGRVGSLPALLPAVDYVGDEAVAWDPPCGQVHVGRPPVAGDDVVARGLWRLWSHPEPEGRPEREDRVLGHRVRVIDQVGVEGAPRLAVVVVAASNETADKIFKNLKTEMIGLTLR